MVSSHSFFSILDDDLAQKIKST